MDWQFESDRPIYSQLITRIKLGIISGDFKPGERLPSVRDIALEAGVNPNTMQRAMQELEREGLVFSQRTAGRFVTEEVTAVERIKEELASKHIEEFLESMKKLGFSEHEMIALLASKIGGEK